MLNTSQKDATIIPAKKGTAPKLAMSNLNQMGKAMTAKTEKTVVKKLSAEEKAAAAEAAKILKAEKAEKAAAIKAAAEAEKVEKLAADKAAKEEAEKIKAAEKQAAKPERIEQNGVKRPIEGGKGHAIWDLADKHSAHHQRPVTLTELTDAAKGHSASTILSEYSKWKKFYGIASRVIDTEKAAAVKAAKEEAKRIREERRASRVEQNGVIKPHSDTKGGQVWDLMDQMSASKGSPVSNAELVAESDARGYNRANSVGWYALWRKFHGISGRIVNPEKAGKTLEILQAQLVKAEEKLEKQKAIVAELSEKIKAATPVNAE